jgi:Transcriptional regulatory protein, C terminal
MKNGIVADLRTATRLPAAVDQSNLIEFKSAGPHYLHHSPKLQLELGDYRIALLPIQDGPRAADLNSRQESVHISALVLPFTWRELVTRVRDQVDDPAPAAADDVAHFGEIHINFIAMEVHRRGRQVKLTALEFKVLKYFVSNPNRVVTRDKLLDQVWGYQSYPCTRTVDNLVLKLRRKLEPQHSQPVHFLTVYGAGYKFMP